MDFEHLFVKVSLHYAGRVMRASRPFMEAAAFIGLASEQKLVLHALWVMARMPVPEHIPLIADRCRKAGIAEWRIRIVLDSRDASSSPPLTKQDS
jgi:hypothetical protein